MGDFTVSEGHGYPLVTTIITLKPRTLDAEFQHFIPRLAEFQHFIPRFNKKILSLRTSLKEAIGGEIRPEDRVKTG
jgi:hypothetical protein